MASPSKEKAVKVKTSASKNISISHQQSGNVQNPPREYTFCYSWMGGYDSDNSFDSDSSNGKKGLNDPSVVWLGQNSQSGRKPERQQSRQKNVKQENQRPKSAFTFAPSKGKASVPLMPAKSDASLQTPGHLTKIKRREDNDAAKSSPQPNNNLIENKINNNLNNNHSVRNGNSSKPWVKQSLQKSPRTGLRGGKFPYRQISHRARGRNSWRPESLTLESYLSPETIFTLKERENKVPSFFNQKRAKEPSSSGDEEGHCHENSFGYCPYEAAGQLRAPKKSSFVNRKPFQEVMSSDDSDDSDFGALPPPPAPTTAPPSVNHNDSIICNKTAMVRGRNGKRVLKQETREPEKHSGHENAIEDEKLDCIEDDQSLELNEDKSQDVDKDSMTPSSDFRTISVIPTIYDLNKVDMPFLRKNKVKGGYANLDHYLDVQFRLLREDFVCPLREGIAGYLKMLTSPCKEKELKEIRIYYDVHVLRAVCLPSCLAYRVVFDVGRLKHVPWEVTKRLMYGALVCLSSDNFQTLYFATVTHRDPVLLKEGLVEVAFEHEFHEVASILSETKFIMAETTAYFEAYRYVLTSLQRIQELPFERYIVHCKKKVQKPSYLAEDDAAIYDLRPLIDDDVVLKEARDVEQNKPCHFSAESKPAERVPVLQREEWPDPGLLKLDDSQFDALHRALTKEFSVIQGPPGTGKTYVGLKIVKALLHNRKIWDPDLNSSMLIVCYTNHALDQFLEGVVSFFKDDVVRVGSRVKSEHLQKYSLNKLRRDMRFSTENADPAYKEITHLRLQGSDDMDQLVHEIDALGVKFECALREILNEDVLCPFMLDRHYDGLQDLQACKQSDAGHGGRKRKKFFSIPMWLGLEDLIHNNSVTSEVLEEIDRDPGESSVDIETDVQVLEHQYRLDTDDAREANEEMKYEKPNTLEQFREIVALDITNLEPQSLRQGHREKTQENRKTSKESSDVKKRNLRGRGGKERHGGRRGATGRGNSRGGRRGATGRGRARGGGRGGQKREEAGNRNEDDETEIPGGNTEGDENLGAFQIPKSNWRKLKRKLRCQLMSGDRMTEDEERKVWNIHQLSLKERWRLYRRWTHKLRESLRAEITRLEEEYDRMARHHKKTLMEEDELILKKATVIAMTTTAAARYQTVLQKVKPKIVVVEEAAEVLEGHVITTLSKDCQHLILIGDHQQLRPKPAVYMLACKYNLELSLFERMIKNGVKCDTLRQQHRMRPEIAALVRPIYPRLENHPSVESYEDVKGITANVYFINHHHQETHDKENESRSNLYEAVYITCLCEYLLKQGYAPSRITVLTSYSGQLYLLKTLMPKQKFDGVRLTGVDSFQGEENDIILLSLVRSNTNNRIGFLKVENRVCVALSRAKMGLYVIGNFNLLALKSKLWRTITENLKEKGALSEILLLRCQNHPNTSGLEIHEPMDFRSAPEGGCMKKCETFMECGHKCMRFCHPYDQKHETYQCLQKCNRSMKCGEPEHVCKKLCYQPCGECKEMVEREMPTCGHYQYMECCTNVETFICQAPCEETVTACGHKCGNVCGKPHSCTEKVSHSWPCGHKGEVLCSSVTENPCEARCEQQLVCGHICQGLCQECTTGRLHVPCTNKCRKLLVCGHACRDKCSRCPPCSHANENWCTHRKNLTNKCGQPLDLCRELCSWACLHYRCSKLCFEPCDRPRCNEPCPKLLGCHHPCVGLCGEPCPPLCRFCKGNELTTNHFGNDDHPDTRFVLLEDCDHVLEVTELDHWMESKTSELEDSVQLKTCPKCKTTIRNCPRYGAIIKQQMLDIEVVKTRMRDDTEQREAIYSRLTCMLNEKKNGRLDVHRSDSLKVDRSLTLRELTCMQNQLQLLEEIDLLERTLTQNVASKDKFHSALQHFQTWTVRVREGYGQQEEADAGTELIRLKHWLLLLRCTTLAEDDAELLPESAVELMDKVVRRFGEGLVYTLSQQASTRELLSTIEKYVPGSSLDIDAHHQRLRFETAMQMCQGHWFKCRSGHIYFVGNFTEVTNGLRCPECNHQTSGIIRPQQFEVNTTSSESGSDDQDTVSEEED